eukprot:GHVP01040570.1.p1 GENE.GHVP01040570.1~~GHVP01040570.1.p1  ORF type:complete len:413 (+),score=72.46 GHVP01040570.1:226-1464(+)
MWNFEDAATEGKSTYVIFKGEKDTNLLTEFNLKEIWDLNLELMEMTIDHPEETRDIKWHDICKRDLTLNCIGPEGLLWAYNSTSDFGKPLNYPIANGVRVDRFTSSCSSLFSKTKDLKILETNAILIVYPFEPEEEYLVNRWEKELEQRLNNFNLSNTKIISYYSKDISDQATLSISSTNFFNPIAFYLPMSCFCVLTISLCIWWSRAVDGFAALLTSILGLTSASGFAALIGISWFHAVLMGAFLFVGLSLQYIFATLASYKSQSCSRRMATGKVLLDTGPPILRSFACHVIFLAMSFSIILKSQVPEIVTSFLFTFFALFLVSSFFLASINIRFRRNRSPITQMDLSDPSEIPEIFFSPMEDCIWEISSEDKFSLTSISNEELPTSNQAFCFFKLFKIIGQVIIEALISI